MIDPYFATINSKFPIWDKSKFQAMVDSIRVPRHYLHMLEELFTHTARCAQATGILQWCRIRGRLRESGFQEYNELAHCLYILDKKGCWTAGVPPRIPAEVQLSLAALYTDKVLEALALWAELAEIEEIIYRNLYTRSSVEPKTKFGNPLRQYGSSLEIDWPSRTWRTRPRPRSNTIPQKAALVFQALSAILALMSAHREQPGAICQ
ncbi:hypothetical protein E4U52_005336 [Claviceps spartinae]|nr:hypothetical protein E4U52_005336 [Claviceps spartinae]